MVSDHCGGYWLCNEVLKIIRHDGKIRLQKNKNILVFNSIMLLFISPTSRRMAPIFGPRKGQDHALCSSRH